MSEYVFRYYKFDIPEDASDDYATENADHYGTIHEPIVRCRDCRFYTHDELGDYCTQFDFGFVMKEFPHGFCSWGERNA